MIEAQKNTNDFIPGSRAFVASTTLLSSVYPTVGPRCTSEMSAILSLSIDTGKLATGTSTLIE